MFNRLSSAAVRLDPDGLLHVVIGGQQVYPLVDEQQSPLESFGAPTSTPLNSDSPAHQAFAAALLLAAPEVAAIGATRVRIAGSTTEYAPPAPVA